MSDAAAARADGVVTSLAGDVTRLRTDWQWSDRLGAWKARWGIGRMHYIVTPGLYAVGNPTPESRVFVTANYAMSVDRLRTQLSGRDGWILVLNTFGINVWCAAGKGTFGTDEMVERVAATRLAEVVSHRKLIVPQLGAPGVSAHEVRKRSGFAVAYGPVRAEDLPAYLDANEKATPEMRRVRFTFLDRLVLTPVELVMSAHYAVAIVAVLFLVAGIGRGGYSTARAVSAGVPAALLFLSAYITGACITPAALPWLPGKAFSTKGACAGLTVAGLATIYDQAGPGLFANGLVLASWWILIPAVSSFLAMNFTGASTYTSLSGVKREMRRAVPLQAAGAAIGLALWLGARFL